MIRRLTALLAMVALLGLLAVLVYEVQEHHRRGFSRPDVTRMVAKISFPAALAS